ncbi:MAG: class I SAM-dependent methyltransferase, partial [Candidatus Cloacimonetes bacterium]|nr:class I SAM-dependent methyltransferase [Candidatus Cloacimonadota bacterium]
MKNPVKYLVNRLPRSYLIKISLVLRYILPLFYWGNKVFCPICSTSFRKFLPYGSKWRKNRLCPRCLSLERHRVVWIFLKEKTDFFQVRRNVLHIAPEQCFYGRFRKLKNLTYLTADLESPLADVKMDIRNMPFADNSFDFIICNHVLEHIDDDKKAIKEIYRILKKGGYALLQVPIDRNRKETLEDDSITDPLEREKLFWDKEHVRLYGLDYPKRLEQAGFKVVEDNF